jgi:hypothetical protein
VSKVKLLLTFNKTQLAGKANWVLSLLKVHRKPFCRWRTNGVSKPKTWLVCRPFYAISTGMVTPRDLNSLRQSHLGANDLIYIT